MCTNMHVEQSLEVNLLNFIFFSVCGTINKQSCFITICDYSYAHLGECLDCIGIWCRNKEKRVDEIIE